MSEAVADALLLFVGDDRPAAWLRLRGGAVVARGEGAPDPLTGQEESERVYAIAPGEDVLLHWAELPELAPAQAIAAARLLVGEVSAEAGERLHVAVGRAEEGTRALAVASAEATAGWIAQAQAIGFDPDHLVPEPLLIAPAAAPRRWSRGGVDLVRGPGLAFAAEPEIAALAGGGAAEALDDAAFEAGLAQALGLAPVDLRQGAFARRRRWGIDWPLMRRLARLAGLVLLAMLAVQLALILRYSFAADALEAQTAGIARTALPRAGAIGNAPAQLEERLSDLRGPGLGFGATAAALFGAVRDSASIELSTLDFERDGSLRAKVSAASAADLAAFEGRLEAQGFTVDAGPAEPGGGRQLADVTMRPRGSEE